jgi:tetratricopeptide (TPR) repeat protein
VEQGLRLGRHSHLVAAEAYLKLRGGDPAGAKDVLAAVLTGEEASQSPFLMAVQGAVLLGTGDLDAARDVLTRAQKANPGDARTAWLLAEQFRRRGEGYELQASGYYDYALRIQKDHVPSILGKGLLLLGRGQVEEANRAAELVLAKQTGASRPQQALARAIRGGALAARGKAAEAAAEEAEAAKLDPSNPDLPWLVGVRKLRAGDAAGAVEAFQRAVALDNKRVSLYADLTRALLAKEGGAAQALDTLKRAVSRLGENPRLSLLLGDAYRAAGDADLARGQYEKAIQLGHPFPDARVALARLYRSQNNIPGALVELTQAIDEYGTGGAGGAAAAYVEMAEAERARSAKPEKLKELFDKALEKDPASCDALWGAARAEYELAKLTEGVRAKLGAYVRSCPAAPHVAEAQKVLGAK